MHSPEKLKQAMTYVMTAAQNMSGLSVMECRQFDMALEILNSYITASTETPPPSPTKQEDITSKMFPKSGKSQKDRKNLEECQAVS